MSFYCKIRNEALICELKHEINSDVLLLGADGFAYFGHLQSIEDCRIAILTPAIAAVTSDVEIITPGGCLVTVNFVRVDLWSIVAKGTGIVKDPVYCPMPCCRETDAEALPNADRQGQDREYDCLVKNLKRLIGDNVALTTTGGFLFEGVLSDICNCLAILTIDEIYIPGCSGYISDRNIRSVVVNLEAITSIAGGETKCHCCSCNCGCDCN